MINFERAWKEAVVAYFRLLYMYWLGRFQGS